MIKAIQILVIYLLSAVWAEDSNQNGQFFEGMQAGYLLRTKMFGHFDHDCPDLFVDMEHMKML